jgi:predicted nucleic acid-binding protein
VRLAELEGRRCYVDANLIIYFLEGHDLFLSRVTPIVSAAAAGQLDLVTGDAAAAEVLVRPYRHGDQSIIRALRSFLETPRLIEVRSHSARDFDDAARIRAAHGTRLIDALHLATARNADCTVLLTADARIPSVAGLQVVRLQDLEELPG